MRIEFVSNLCKPAPPGRAEFFRRWHDKNSVALDRFELLELRRDDGVQVFHAREVATARPVQVHLFTQANVAESLALLSRLNQLPEPDRRRILDRGTTQGFPYVVTDRLAGFANLREWLDSKTAPAPAPSRSLDQQFFDLFDASVPEPPALEDDSPEPANRVAAIALGLAVAVLFLLLVIGLFAFHPK